MKELVKAGNRRYLRCSSHGEYCHFFYCISKRVSTQIRSFIYYVCEEGFSFRLYEGKRRQIVAVMDRYGNYKRFTPVPLVSGGLLGQKAQPCRCMRQLQGGEKNG